MRNMLAVFGAGQAATTTAYTVVSCVFAAGSFQATPRQIENATNFWRTRLRHGVKLTRYRDGGRAASYNGL